MHGSSESGERTSGERPRDALVRARGLVRVCAARWRRRPAPRRSALALFGLALLGLAAAFAALGAVAQTSGTASGVVDEAEAEALQLYRDEQLLGARTKAEEILARNPSSLMGHFVLAAVLREAEGSLARSMYHFGKVRELYETTWSPSARPADAPWELHRDTLYQIQGLAGEMELHEYRIEVIGYHDYLYDPDLLAERAWPLVRLGRYAEAREFAQRAAANERDAWQRSGGLNALCAVEGEAGTREPWWQACSAALENARRRRDAGEEAGVAVHAYNAALAALGALRFEEAEALALDGARRLEMTPANPWRILALQYLGEGKGTEAVEALGQMQRWRQRQPAYLRDQDRAETDVVFATVLLVAGETETGLRAVDRAIAQPDRRGLTTSTAEQTLGAHALLRRALARTAAEQRAEEASARGGLAVVGGALGVMGDRLGSWPDDERVAGVLADDAVVVATFRPYVRGGMQPVPTWLVGDLVDVLGAGVVEVALSRARGREDQPSPAAGYFDALGAEVALAQGDEQEALSLARSAIEALPAREALLSARVSAIAAEASRRSGRARDELAFLEEVLAKDGGVLRRLGMTIPASVTSRGGGLAGLAADRLEGSPRLRSERGFEVVVESPDGNVVSACLLSPHGARIGCAQVDPAALAREHAEAMEAYRAAVAARAASPRGGGEGGSAEEGGGGERGGEEDERVEPEPKDPVVALVTGFHDQIFRARLTLSTVDLRSLDGSVSTGEDAARERMRDLLDHALQRQP